MIGPADVNSLPTIVCATSHLRIDLGTHGYTTAEDIGEEDLTDLPY